MSTSALVEEARVERWRFERLLEAQSPMPTAMTLATRLRRGPAHAVDLLGVGCPSRTILDILL